MNPLAILTLISELYTQVAELTERVRQLSSENELLKTKE